MAGYSLPDIFDQNPLALGEGLMELTLHVVALGCAGVGDRVRGALEAIGENSGHKEQGLAYLNRLP